jgi:S1-C subfamily serine protease
MAPVVTKETTVVVKDDDAVASAIASAQQGMVRIVSANDKDMLLARGIIVDAKGAVLSDRGSLEPMGTLNFMAYLPDGTLVPAVMREPTGTSTIAVLDLKLSTSTQFTPVPLADPTKLKLGQTVIRIGGSGGDTVGTGVVAKLPVSMSAAHRDLIESSVVSNTPGSVLLDLFGNAVGITTSDSLNSGSDFYTLVH